MDKAVKKKVRFELNAPSAKKVLLAGDFNNWDKKGIPLKKNKSGLWVADLNLKPGKYEYKFIVDGQWQKDQLNKASVNNPYGSENSVKQVG